MGQAAGRSAARARSRVVEDIERLCSDAGIAPEQLAIAAGVPASYLRRILAGKARASLETYAKLAIPLGADLSARLYANTGPLVRDRHQARMTEALIGIVHPRWHVHLEVGVSRPSRGWIDAVLHDEPAGQVVAVEVESDMRRIEQQIRWSRMKADSLPSWVGWPAADAPAVSQLLVVRRTRATRQTMAEFAGQLAVAYPAHPEDVLRALRGPSAWPGATLYGPRSGRRACSS